MFWIRCFFQLERICMTEQNVMYIFLQFLTFSLLYNEWILHSMQQRFLSIRILRHIDCRRWYSSQDFSFLFNSPIKKNPHKCHSMRGLYIIYILVTFSIVDVLKDERSKDEPSPLEKEQFHRLWYRAQNFLMTSPISLVAESLFPVVFQVMTGQTCATI